MDGAYYFSLFGSSLIALAAFSLDYDASSSLLVSVFVGLGAFWITFLSVLVLSQQHERVLRRYSLWGRRLVKKIKRKI